MIKTARPMIKTQRSNSLKIVPIIVGIILSLSGCAGLSVSNLGEAPKVDNETISVIDKRSPEQKQPKRDSVLSPIAVLGDENVQPPAILFLQSYLQQHQKQRTALKIELNEFYVIDFFPTRLKAATYSGGWLTDAVVRDIIQSKTDWAFVNSVGVPKDLDSIVCLFFGTVNGKSVKVAAYAPYQTSPMVVSIRNDPAFTGAVKSAIGKTANEILLKVEKHN